MSPQPGQALGDWEAEARQQTLGSLTAGVRLVDRGLFLIVEGLEPVRGEHPRYGWLETILTLTFRSFNDLRAAQILLVNGYPAQALVMTRTAFEDYLAAQYISKDHRKARFWSAKKYCAAR